MERYRVEKLVLGSNTWETVHHTDSLPVARRYAASLRNPGRIKAARVVDQETDQAVYYDPDDARPGRVGLIGL